MLFKAAKLNSDVFRRELETIGRRPVSIAGGKLALALFWLACGCLLGGCRTPATAAASSVARKVSGAELLRAMRAETGYDPGATTNQVRFHSSVLLRLAAAASKRDPSRRPLLISPEDWFNAYLKRLGKSAEHAPPAARLAFENRQQIQLDYRLEKVMESNFAPELPKPRLAVNVQLWWNEQDNPAHSFAFVDQTSVPRLEVLNERTIKYRLLDLSGVIVCDQIRGLRGKPVSGLISLPFKLIGPADVVAARFVVNPDGGQLVFAQARKGIFSKRVLVHIDAKGRAREGLPPGRQDLDAAAKRLTEMRTDYAYLDF